MKDTLLSWLLLPVYIWQGIGIRRRIERMPPAAGPHSGQVGAGEDAPAIRLLLIGDSSAAGVGVDRIEQSLAPRLAERLYALTGAVVAWRAAGSNSAVCAEVRDFVVPNIAREGFTHIVLSIGTNDVKNFHSARRFKRSFGTLLYALRARWPEARIVWSPPVDMLRVPALPRGLALVLELRSRILRRVGTRLCLERGAIPATQIPRVEPAGFSRDGFHASVEGHAYVAGHLAAYVLGDMTHA
ncbi:G-D-S-L family lipolytic protein [Aureimonas ureilytica]|uniref:G-D-S-L family lipolytic protein n=1 Tax=Aureimonas ureilytica TaxID=401562 RepID=A0A175R6L2_9HYPH|nr:SGNH/GDSL hydrolase family protein [Aureimonas ureilytica]KTQ94059.1 G-D-S-L family lipolytic protein [Aureimonas ureilytica]KTR05066.1 G-D-S-L family lipolytic protein [Aureimonas ureilytica]